MSESEGDSCLDDSPDIVTDVYDFMIWECRRLSLLIRLPSSKFNYDDVSGTVEAEKECFMVRRRVTTVLYWWVGIGRDGDTSHTTHTLLAHT